jgi:carbamoyltransferase
VPLRADRPIAADVPSPRSGVAAIGDDPLRGHAGMASVVVGLGGARRNAAVACVVDGRLAAFCQHERITRIRSVGLRSELPTASIKAVLEIAGKRQTDVGLFVTAEPDAVFRDVPGMRAIGQHRAHAATAAFTSPFADAAVIVCDSDADTPVTIWRFENGDLSKVDWPWTGPGLASLYSDCTALFGFRPGAEHQLEALARLDPGERADAIAATLRYQDGGIEARGWKAAVSEGLAACGGPRNIRGAAAIASAFQRALGDALVALVADVRAASPSANVCLAGGLFYNSYLVTRVVEAAAFARVYVPPNPGNAGSAAGAALAAAAERGRLPRGVANPFLGPDFSHETVKATLDNCKLTYAYLSERDVVDQTVKALRRGELVGWFQGAMEAGPRSLGNRSILANPLAPHVLENLNTFLKRREPYRAYALSVCLEEADRDFHVPAPSPFMELEYRLRDANKFRFVVPEGARTLRVQTIDDRPGVFRDLHRAFADATGNGVLVNTSFNGFHEPVVCSPRDAIRVFYGGGLDMLVLGRFVLRK